MFVVSLNGPDNVGKSTHLRMLRWSWMNLPDMGGIHLYGQEWPSVEGAVSKWWFEECPSVDLIRLIASSFKARNHFGTELRSDLLVLDRGIKQFEAVMIATIAIKERMSLSDAAAWVKDIIDETFADYNFESVKILLTHGHTVEESVSITLKREPAVTDTYARYQFLLHTILLNQAESGDYDVIIDCDGESIIAVQNRIRETLSQRGLPVEQLLPSVRRIYAFGGLSESGKSLGAEYLRRRKNVTRLKISYLLEIAALRQGTEDIYGLEALQQAELFVLEIDRFARRHYYMPFLSVESLHGYDMAVHLKRLLGEMVTIIYCSASLQIRLSRSVGQESSLLAKDEVKRERGADLIEQIADVQLNNNGDIPFLYFQLDKVFASTNLKAMSPIVRSIEELQIPEPLASKIAGLLDEVRAVLGTQLLLFAVVGSWGRRCGQFDKSDVDILIGIEGSTLERLRTPLSKVLAQEPKPKFGFTVVTREELTSGRLDIKSIHALRLMSRGEIGVQFIAEGLKLHEVSAETDLFQSLDQWAAVVQGLRRDILQPKPDVRGLFKACILLAKILLRTEGTEIEDEREVMHAFSSKFSDKTLGALFPAAPQTSADALALGLAVLSALESMKFEAPEI